jgi:2-polyprenyl-6-methoxyphenol hydroxylase-like FAD-dependent oxidoreductase
MDPITGQGISHAFRGAELLADAVADGLGGIRPLAEALRGYHRARDRAARPMNDFTARLAFGQARPQRPGPHVPAQPSRLEKTAGRAPATELV